VTHERHPLPRLTPLLMGPPRRLTGQAMLGNNGQTWADTGRQGQTAKGRPIQPAKPPYWRGLGVDVWSALGEWDRPRSTAARADWTATLRSFPQHHSTSNALACNPLTSDGQAARKSLQQKPNASPAETSSLSPHCSHARRPRALAFTCNAHLVPNLYHLIGESASVSVAPPLRQGVWAQA
jgi:hypothetical protein